MLVTGGGASPTTVSRYGKEGWIEDFSSGLNTGRWRHGCSSFLSEDYERVCLSRDLESKDNPLTINQVLLVTGGWTGQERLDSTEVYRPSAGEWREVHSGVLPRPMRGVRVVTLNNRALLFGENIWVTIIIRLYL